MEEDNSESPKQATFHHGNVNFNRISAVAEEWMLDFLFVSLCRRFKEGKLDEFNGTLQAFQAIQSLSESDSRILKGEQKRLICAFLARIMHGKQLDVKFEQDHHVMPLMSAAKIWSDLEDTVEDESLFKNITVLLLVQSVAVCLEKGQRSSASSALKWFENNTDFPQNLRVKLSAIVTQSDTYHPFLMSFSFSRLLETVQSYLVAYLERNPSDYLLQRAVKMVQSSQSSEDIMKQENSLSLTANADESTAMSGKKRANTTCLKTKRKLRPTKITDVWKPESCKKRRNLPDRISKREGSELMFPQESSEKPADTTKITKTRQKQKWTPHLDKFLKAGVRRHGAGQWARILLEYDFEGRTGTMLKDRWRVLVKSHLAS